MIRLMNRKSGKFETFRKLMFNQPKNFSENVIDSKVRPASSIFHDDHKFQTNKLLFKSQNVWLINH